MRPPIKQATTCLVLLTSTMLAHLIIRPCRAGTTAFLASSSSSSSFLPRRRHSTTSSSAWTRPAAPPMLHASTLPTPSTSSSSSSSSSSSPPSPPPLLPPPSYNHMDALTTKDGLPLVYEPATIKKYWDQRPSEMNKRWALFLSVTAPFLTKLGE